MPLTSDASRATQATAIIFAGLIVILGRILTNIRPVAVNHGSTGFKGRLDWIVVVVFCCATVCAGLLAIFHVTQDSVNWVSIMPSVGLLCFSIPFSSAPDGSFTRDSEPLSSLLLKRHITNIAAILLALGSSVYQLIEADIITGSLNIVGISAAILGAHVQVDVISTEHGGPAHEAVYGSPTLGERTNAYYFDHASTSLKVTEMRGAEWVNREAWKRLIGDVRGSVTANAASLRSFVLKYTGIAMEFAETEAKGKTHPKELPSWRLIAKSLADAETNAGPVPLQNLWYVVAVIERTSYRTGPRLDEFNEKQGSEAVWYLVRRLTTYANPSPLTSTLPQPFAGTTTAGQDPAHLPIDAAAKEIQRLNEQLAVGQLTAFRRVNSTLPVNLLQTRRAALRKRLADKDAKSPTVPRATTVNDIGDRKDVTIVVSNPSAFNFPPPVLDLSVNPENGALPLQTQVSSGSTVATPVATPSNSTPSSNSPTMSTRLLTSPTSSSPSSPAVVPVEQKDNSPPPVNLNKDSNQEDVPLVASIAGLFDTLLDPNQVKAANASVEKWILGELKEHGIDVKTFNNAVQEAFKLSSSWPIVMLVIIEFFWTLRKNKGGRYNEGIQQGLIENNRVRRSWMLALLLLQGTVSTTLAAAQIVQSFVTANKQ